MTNDSSRGIAAATASLDRALVHGTPDEIAAHFTEDAVLGESGSTDALGRAAIRGLLAVGNLARAVTHHRLVRDELILLDDRAIEFGWFEETKPPHGGTPVVERGRTVAGWRRGSDGAWRIARLVLSDFPAP